MSLLNGLKDAMINPLFDAVNESDVDNDLDFELALEAVVDKQIELSEDDYAAILDDENPDNVVADISDKDEKISKIAKEVTEDDFEALESMLDELLATEEIITDDQGDEIVDPESTESCKSECGSKATEMDDTDPDAEEYTDSSDDEIVSLDALLDSIFKN